MYVCVYLYIFICTVLLCTWQYVAFFRFVFKTWPGPAFFKTQWVWIHTLKTKNVLSIVHILCHMRCAEKYFVTTLDMNQNDSYIMRLDLYDENFVSIIVFNFSPCCRWGRYSSGYFPGVWILKADVSEPSVGSIFTDRRLFLFGILKLFILCVVSVNCVVGVVVTGEPEDFNAKFGGDSWSYQ
jgi:hypothetical protein